MSFGRVVFAEIGPAGGTGRRLRGLRTGFRVTHTRTKTPSPAVIEVYNPAPDTLGIAQRGAVVRLYAGHEMPRTIFLGTVTRGGASLSVRGGDRVFKIEAADGGRRFTDARIALSYRRAVTLGEVLDEVVEAADLPRGVIRVDRSVTFAAGLVLRGRVAEVLDRLAVAGAGARGAWFVRDGALVVVPTDSDTGEAAIVVSGDNGTLLRSPEVRDDGSVAFEALLDPALRPGRVVDLRSAWRPGFVVLDEVTFAGDSGFDALFVAQCVGRFRERIRYA